MPVLNKTLKKFQQEGPKEAVFRGFDIVQRRFHREFISNRRASKLSQSEYPPDQLVAKAISDTVSENIPPSSRPYVEKIEEIRSGINTSDESITVTDYGALYNGETQMKLSDAAMSKPHNARLLYHLARLQQPTRVLELGTSVGVSAAYLAAALELNEAGEVITLEGAETLADIAETTLESVGLSNATVVRGQFSDVLPDVLSEQIDMVFIDGHHDEEATKEYFNQIEPSLSSRAIVIFDDIRWSDGMKRAWDALKNDDRLTPIVSTQKFGICVLDSTGRSEPETILL